MGTATFRTAALVLAALTVALAGAGCGGTSAARSSTSPAAAHAFGWLRPAAAPRGWTVAHLPAGGTLPYPADWRTIKTDPGTASAALFASGGRMIGYLNLTPQDGGETLANWVHFRVSHNADENDRRLQTIAAAGGLRFRSGPGSCVQDAYTTTSNARYIEIACLVSGHHGGVVIVGAAPPDAWRTVAPSLQRAISAVTT
jgi:hypothetical protein